MVLWDQFRNDLMGIISQGNAAYVLPRDAREDLDMEHNLHVEEETKILANGKLKLMQVRNGQPMVPGKWRKEPYGTRSYDPLTAYTVTSSIPSEEAGQLMEQLVTPLNGFLGQSYNYDDHDLTEEWMCSFKVCPYI